MFEALNIKDRAVAEHIVRIQRPAYRIEAELIERMGFTIREEREIPPGVKLVTLEKRMKG